MKRVAIVSGWSEGPWQSRQFRKRLWSGGFKVIKNVGKADVIFAHSAGCFWIQPSNRAELIILVGPNHWPGRSYFKSALLNTLDGLKHHRANGSVVWWAAKLLHNSWYVLTRPQDSLGLFMHVAEESLPDGESRKVVLVRNKNDSFCHPNIQELLPKTNRYKFVQLNGDHEDCWLNPDPYVDLIKKEIRIII